MAKSRDILETALIGIGATASALVLPVLPVVGVPLMATALAWLFYRRGPLAGWLIAGFIAAFVALVDTTAALLVAPVALMAPAAAHALGKVSAWKVAAYLGAVVLAGYAGMTLGTLLHSGYTLTEVAASGPKLIYEETVTEIKALDFPPDQEKALLDNVNAARKSLVDGFSLLPSLYVLLAGITGVATVTGVSWAGRKAGLEVRRFPALSEVEVSFHVMWGLIASLALLAYSAFAKQPTGTAATIGWNLFGIVRWVFFVQGLAVFSALYEKVGMGRVQRFFGLALVFLLELFVFGASLLGLVDMWANFRRLDRGDGAKARPQ